MYEDFTPTRTSVTPNYILEVLRDSYRQQCQYDPEAVPDVELSFHTTVAEWRETCDLLPWRRVADANNDWWGFRCSLDEWQATLEPAEERTLYDVCSLIARHAKLPQSCPAMLLGSPCLSGGTFLAIRSLLREAGADPREIAPSTPLESYSRRYLGVFLGPISWIAPGALPPVKIHHPIYDAAIWGFVGGWVSLLVGVCTLVHWLTIIGVLTSAFSYAMGWIASKCMGPSRVEFGDLKTFRDLAVLVATTSAANKAVSPCGGSGGV